MNLFLNPFLPEKTHTDDSVSFHVTPTLDHGPIVCLRSFGVRQSICLKGFRDHEESDSDRNFRFVVVQYWIYNNLSLSVLKLC